jgi:uncharacterized protein
VKVLFLVATLVACVCAVRAIAADFTIPPTPDHYVTDNAGVLSAGTRASLENRLQAYQSTTGHQIIVWIDQTTGDVPLETWTGETADHWKVGRRGHDDGAVLFIFMQDHKVRIEVGYGLESALTDADSYRIIQNVIRPRMRTGDVDGAVSSGVAAMLTTISPSYKGATPPPEESQTSIGTNGIIVIVVLALIVLFVIFLVLMQIVGAIRYGYLVTREGSLAARRDMRRWWFWGGGYYGGIGSSFVGSGGWGGGGGFGGGFSAGGGGFGGGGASGGW